jgi:predicted GH43/DUF377 family glycosyl hydrolase
MAEPRAKKAKKKVETKKLGARLLRRFSGVRKVTKAKLKSPTALRKFESNPIIEPSPDSFWESKATFNPSAVYGDGRVHLIYRAIGENDVSMLGYASSRDGLNISSRGKHPAFFQSVRFTERHSGGPISYESGGGWSGGSEDPRLTKIGDRLYMLFTSFDGWNAIRIALTSISFDDFTHERWHWEKPVFISPPGQIHKNWVLFPEKINGKYAILHGISPNILIEYIKDLREFDGKKYIKSQPPNGKGNPGSWDSWVRGVGPSPIKTKYGWLVLYHAMDVTDPNRYKLGAMLLDLNDPTKVLIKSIQPILEPDERYENEGFKSGVIYACGATVVGGWLFVYYGGADKVVCVATAELEPFLQSLKSSSVPPKLTRAKAPKNVI